MITGAGSGIGRAAARLAAAEGFALVLADRDEDGLRDTVAAIGDASARVHTVVADLADPASPRRIIEEAAGVLGGIDAVLSNAGMTQVSSLKDLSVEAFDLAIAVNTRPTLLLGQAAHPWLAKSKGAIVATASISATQPTPPLGAYSASKAALVIMVQQMALEWGPDGIRCNTVSPGPTMTGMTVGVFNDVSDEKQARNRASREAHLPLRKVGRPEEVAAALMFLASPQASQITGVDIAVDGGLSLALMPSVGGGSGHDTK